MAYPSPREWHHGRASRILSNLGVGNYCMKEGGTRPINVGEVRLSPITVPFDCTVDRVAHIVAAVNGNVRMGIYECETYGYPDLPDAGDLQAETASYAQGGPNNSLQWGDVDVSLEAGLYFVGLQGDDGSYWRTTEGYTWRHNVDGTVYQPRNFNQVFGVFSNPCPVTGNSLYPPIVFMRVASIP